MNGCSEGYGCLFGSNGRKLDADIRILKNLVKLGINDFKAWEYANTRKGYWHTSNSPILACSLTNNYLKDLGLLSFTEVYNNALNSMNRYMLNGTYGGEEGRNGK